MSQMERNEVITAFKHKSMPILTATDVAGLMLAISVSSDFAMLRSVCLLQSCILLKLMVRMKCHMISTLIGLQVFT